MYKRQDAGVGLEEAEGDGMGDDDGVGETEGVGETDGVGETEGVGLAVKNSLKGPSCWSSGLMISVPAASLAAIMASLA